jgi:chemotaxis protein MotB
MERRRRQKRPEHDNHERWLISYADFVTLLLAFFIVMYAISSLNEGKYKVFNSSLITAFGKEEESQLSNIAPPIVLPMTRSSKQDMLMKSLVDRRNARLGERVRAQQERLQGIARNLNQAMESLVKSGQVRITQTDRGVELDISASVLFAEGEAELQAGSIKILDEVAQVLKPGEQLIEVEGHTDNVPISTSRYPSNWELSSARASSVVRLFIDRGLAESRLTVVGLADTHPMASNDTPDGRALNRRVAIIVMAPPDERPATAQ